MHATLIEAVPGFAIPVVIEIFEVAGHTLVDRVVLARYRMDAIDMKFLKQLTRLAEFLRFDR